MVTDLVPMPSNVEAEQAVLGAILLQNDAYYRIAATLDPSDFYQPRHAVIYATMRRLLNAGTPVDLISLYDAGLEKNCATSYSKHRSAFLTLGSISLFMALQQKSSTKQRAK